MVKEGWLSVEMDQKTVVEWVDQLVEKLIEMREVVVEREKAAKASMKAQYDKKVQSSELEVGMLVLVRTPNLSGKLDDLWDGPFKITRKVSSVTNELAVPDRRSKRRMAHINMLKAWNPPDASLLGMVVVAEEEDEGQERGKVLAELPALAGRQIDKVGGLLAEYNDVVRQEVGRARDICHEIDTGNEKPIRTCPYRLAPAWRASWERRSGCYKSLAQWCHPPALGPHPWFQSESRMAQSAYALISEKSTTSQNQTHI